MEAEARIWPDYDDSYILFERAIVARDEGAWAVLYARYHCLLTTWVRRFGAFVHINESCEDLADQAFARGGAFRPEHHADTGGAHARPDRPDGSMEAMLADDDERARAGRAVRSLWAGPAAT